MIITDYFLRIVVNFKDLIVPFAVALLGTWAIQTFFLSKQAREQADGSVHSGRTFTAPLSVQDAKPLNLEVDFIDNESELSEVKSKVETENAVFVFSNYGATLENLFFKMSGDRSERNTKMLLPSVVNNRENSCFLVALDQNTPYYYRLVNRTEDDNQVTLVYQVESDNVVIEKKFIISKATHKIDLALKVAPKGATGVSVQARIIYPSPRMETPIKYDEISAIYNSESGAIDKASRSNLNLRRGWFAPTLFGTENKYFIQSLINDHNNFAQRAYYKSFGDNQLSSFLEGPVIEAPAQWNLSFYFGPKKKEAVALVDSRLEQTFGYFGFFSPLSRLLDAALKYINTYVGNYGLAIILLTLLFRLIMLPFTLKGERGMKQQAEVSKKIEYLKRRYRNEPKILAREQQELLKKHGVPGAAGCLTALIQFPVFFALRPILSDSFSLYQAPFLWIKDLSAPDPYSVLPIIMSGGMIAQALVGDPKQRNMMLGMGLLIGTIAMNMTSGLALYLLVSTLFGFFQKFLSTKLKLA